MIARGFGRTSSDASTRIRAGTAALVAGAVLVAVLGACTRPPPGDESGLQGVAATVRRFPIDSDQFVLVPDSTPDIRYVPDDLPEAMREDGLAVIFDAQLLPVPDNVRLVGPPVRILAIRPRGAPRS